MERTINKVNKTNKLLFILLFLLYLTQGILYSGKKWERTIQKCKEALTNAFLEDMHSKYGQIKGQIDKDFADLQMMLNDDQLTEITKSLGENFKQMAPMVLQKKERQFKPCNQPNKGIGINKAN